MAVKKTGLGKGLDALFSSPIVEENNNSEEIVKKLKYLFQKLLTIYINSV